MIIYKQGSLLNVTEGIIAHGCNAQGVMGSGIAKQIRDKYPEAYQTYLLQCQSKPGLLGSTSLVEVTKTLKVANCITQEFYGRDPKLVYVDYSALCRCMTTLVYQPEDIHIPKIGAGLANGNWLIIEKIINDIFSARDITCWYL